MLINKYIDLFIIMYILNFNNKQYGVNLTMKKILIVGGVAGGASAAARLRRLN